MNGVDTVLLRAHCIQQQFQACASARERAKKGTRKPRERERNARYADAELDVFGFARYCCHAVVHGRSEAREPIQVRLIRRREGLRRYRVRVYINIHVRVEYVQSHVGSNSVNPADSYGLGYETKE